MLRMPSRVVFPFGYRISVHQISDTEMDRRDPNADGIWDDATKTIYLRKRLPLTETALHSRPRIGPCLARLAASASR